MGRPRTGTSDPSSRVAAAAGAGSARRLGRVQELWSGYGEVVRYALDDGRRVVAKHVRPGAGSGRSHARKLRSYEVEQAFYARWATRCPADCRVPEPLHVERADGEWLFVLEDLDAAGFEGRAHALSNARLDACLRWLAAFHAAFLAEAPRGLWPVGTYWHLATRPDELAAMPRGPLRDAASALDARLSGARYRTFVHGDAKPANFCFHPDGRAAAVDFQYVGGGCGMKDVAYLLAGEDAAGTRRALDRYFAELRARLPGSVDAEALEAEWRALHPLAWADFHRFLAGWSPGYRPGRGGRALTEQALASL